jgi:hypothetical protein
MHSAKRHSAGQANLHPTVRSAAVAQPAEDLGDWEQLGAALNRVLNEMHCPIAKASREKGRAT